MRWLKSLTTTASPQVATGPLHSVEGQGRPRGIPMGLVIALLVVGLLVVLRCGGESVPTELWAASEVPIATVSAGLQPYALPSPSTLVRSPLAAYTKADRSRLFGDFGCSGRYLAGMRAGTRVVVLARSADGAWTRVRIPQGTEGWIRTDRLLIPRSATVPVPTIIPVPRPETVFQDDFSNTGNGLPQETNESYTLAQLDGKYVMRQPGQGQMFAAYPADLVFMDFVLEVKAQVTGEGDAILGIAFRVWDDGYFLLTISPTGWYSLRRVVGSIWTDRSSGNLAELELEKSAAPDKNHCPRQHDRSIRG